MNGYNCHADNLLEFIRQSNLSFDAICISETSLMNEQKIANESRIEGFKDPFTTNSTSCRGGVAIFTKQYLDATEREDLKIQTHEFEAVWTEINNKGSKNTVIGSIYRHPHSNNLDEFHKYISKCLTILSKQNKDVYIAGDFNIDLLRYEKDTKFKEFYNLMSSYGYLPLIIQPTRITDTTHSLIDNIYTNCIGNECQSGNVLIEMADHLTQFASITKQESYNVPGKNQYKRDTKKWDEKSFLDDLSIQRWETSSNDVNKQFDDLLFKFEGCVDRHLP